MLHKSTNVEHKGMNMADAPTKPSADEIQQAADRWILRTRHLDQDKRAAETLQRLGSITNAESEALKRRDTAKALEAEALVALDKVKTEAATVIANARSDAEKIIDKARSDAEELAAKTRRDLEDELSSTNDALTAARTELAAVTAKSARIRAAIDG